jgi:intraflagellar transport protein 46
LPVSPEIKEIFKFIERYQPQTIELEFKLKPFIPEYIPCIGDIDAFLKVIYKKNLNNYIIYEI